jgi:RNA polymerase sigma-70 factor, ECF subfamily
LSAVAPQPAETAGLLYERYSGRIYGFCLSLLGSREEAEDAVQTTFLNAQRGLGRGVVPEFELAWLFKIARNVCNNRRVSTWRRDRVESVRDLETLQDVIAGPERSADVSIEDLTRALAGVPERQRRALLLREWQGLSYNEIAAELDVSVAAVETLIFRARRSVAEQLEQRGTKRRRGVAASVGELFRWLFTGGAAPVKIAAATAVVTAAAAVAVVPTVRHHGPAVTPSPAIDVVSPNIAPTHVSRVTRLPMAPTPKPRPIQRSAPTESVSAPRASTQTPITSSAPLPKITHTSANATANEAPAAPAATLPAVTTPTVSTETLPLPELSVPQVEVPQVEVPQIQLPPTPQLPPPPLPTLP